MNWTLQHQARGLVEAGDVVRHLAHADIGAGDWHGSVRPV